MKTPLQLLTAPATPSSLTGLVLVPSPKDIRVQRLIFDFVLDRHGTLSAAGYMEFVPNIYHSCQPGSSLDLAIEALAYTNLGRRGHAPHLAAFGAQKYGEAVQRTGAALQDFSTATMDETLLSCQLLAMYEVGR